ncbi:MAG: transposase [Gemmatimonadaceae bacterium]
MRHRGVETQQDLALLKARDQLVKLRTDTINQVRGAVKATGARLPKCSVESFAKQAALHLPDTLGPALTPLLTLVTTLTTQIGAYERQSQALIATRYPAAAQLQQPAGVGPLTALAFVLLVEDPHRFPQSRRVGAYSGLVPRLEESSNASPQLRISRRPRSTRARTVPRGRGGWRVRRHRRRAARRRGGRRAPESRGEGEAYGDML